ncbi:GlxA family transcriptional regulator [Rheinheimera faecalis]|uniref:GlxA family transcriptional regulator n=1 Tax=Rheinheimera faecalis TaxID=2901141 RepID=UPI001E292FE8|nr:GlxA family transcriptional regulator [Rheinheimera faecalis]
MNKRIGLIVYDDFQILDLAALTVFEFANTMQQKIHYQFASLSVEGGAVRSSSGVVIETQPIGFGTYDTLVIAGALLIPKAMPALEAKLNEAASGTNRIASICSGAFVLAKSGLLDGKRATTHWAWGRHLQDQHPAVLVDEDKIYVKDGQVWTSAGATACIDLALALVEADLGAEVTKSIARLMVVHHRRTGGQSQFSAMTELEPSSDRVRDALRFAKENLQKDLTVDDLAEHVHWSPRHFSRVFHSQTGMAPAKAIEKLRLEAAKSLIEQGHSSISRIATMTGFGDEERMRRAFLRTYGQSPKAFVHLSRLQQDNVYLS